MRIRPLSVQVVWFVRPLCGRTNADGQRTDADAQRTDADGQWTYADGQRTDGTHTAHGQCSFVTIDNLSISLDPLLASGRMRTDSGRTADGCGRTADGRYTYGARTM